MIFLWWWLDYTVFYDVLASPAELRGWFAWCILGSLLLLMLALGASLGQSRSKTWCLWTCWPALKLSLGLLEEPRCPKMSPRGRKLSPRGSKMSPRGPKMAPIRPQEGSKMAWGGPRWLQEGPRKTSRWLPEASGITYLLTYLPNYLLTYYLLTYLPTYLLTYLPTCLLTYLPTYRLT